MTQYTPSKECKKCGNTSDVYCFVNTGKQDKDRMSLCWECHKIKTVLEKEQKPFII